MLASSALSWSHGAALAPHWLQTGWWLHNMVHNENGFYVLKRSILPSFWSYPNIVKCKRCHVACQRAKHVHSTAPGCWCLAMRSATCTCMLA